jgi:hypothetical protein
VKARTPRKWRRTQCNVPHDNHEVIESDGPWECRSCSFLGDLSEAIAHIIERQFVPETK